MTVLVARLDTPESPAALRAAVEEARRRKEDLVVFDLAGTQLDPVSETIEGVQVSFEQPDARQRDEAGSLLDAANRLDASVVVIGIKHRTATGKLLFGSIAQRILLEATAPVLAVKS